MASDLASEDAPSAEPGWDEVQLALEEIARLSLDALPRAEFHAAILAKTVDALGAVAGAIWMRSAEHALALDAQCRLAQTDLEVSPNVRAGHERLVAAACSAGSPRAVAPSQTLAGGQGTNPSSFLLTFAPLRLGSDTIGVIELVERADVAPAVRPGHVQFLAAVSELAADFHRQQQLRDLALREGHWQRLEQFIHQVHGSIELRATAYAIANEGRRFVDCDRVSVATHAHGRCRMVAISGVETIERRSDAVTRMEKLAQVVALYGEPVWFPAARETLPPELETAVDSHLDASQARLLAAIPLRSRRASAAGEQAESGRHADPLAILFVEQFRSATPDAAFRQRVEMVAQHAGSALASALAVDSLPLVGLARALERVGWLTRARQLPKTLAALMLIAAIGLGLTVVPADFSVEARGELQPRLRREIFAPDDAIVSEVRIVAGQKVGAGDVLVTLRKPQLEFERHRVLGETQTARKRLSAIRAARLGSDRTKPETPERYNQLTAEEEEVKATLAGLQKQDQVLQEQQAALVVRSPIDGQVLTWEVEQLLETRPVQRGKALMTIGDLAGPWQLELRLPDHHAGYVLDARQEIQPDLRVTYLLATNPSVTYEGRIDRVGLAATNDEVYGPNVPLVVDIDRAELSDSRPGATVVGKIHCGRRSIGFVWFHDLISVIRSRLLF